MNLLQRLEGFGTSFDAIAAVSSVQSNLGFADLFPWYESDDFNAYIQRLVDQHNPGVLLETDRRMFALEEHGGELRFYAGGAGQRVYGQPYEMGVFSSLEDAAKFGEAFLVRQMHPQEIAVPRELRSSNYDWGRVDVSPYRG